MANPSDNDGFEAERFGRLDALLDEVLELPAAQRTDALRKGCGGDERLYAEACDLLAAVDASEGFLEPALPEAASNHDGADRLAGTRVGVWSLCERIGRGGSGDVWRAERRDGQFEQQVAIKLLRDWSEQDVPRFLREQRLLARLQHPGIARLLDAGRIEGGQPYMAMELVAGDPIVRHAQQRRLGIDARLALFLQVCEAVAHAHRHLVLHRDLKPQNILVRDDGHAVLLDFGIARRIDEQAVSTLTATRRFTPQYAAPEQLAGEDDTTATDVYALGLLLHELLTDQPPWGALARQGALALLQRAAAGPLPTPSSQVPRERARALRGDLDAIVQKATRPEPEQRYASVDALMQDVRAHRGHRPVQARGDAFGYRLRRGLRRYWLAASATLLIVAALLAALVLVTMAQREAAGERDAARIEASRSKAVRDYLALMFREAGQRARDGDALTAKDVLDQAAARIDASFRENPVVAAEVLKALGELHFHIDDYVGAAPLLQRWLAREQDIADAASAADVRFTLAESLHRMGRSDEAAHLLAQAQAFWMADPARYAEVLLTSRMLQSQLQRQRGEIEAGIATLEAALPQRLRRSGPVQFETAVLYTNLGAAYIQAGRLDEGIARSQEAMQTWRALDLEHSHDALNTLNNLAAAYFRQGDLARADAAFAQALQLRRRAFGPSAATAALMGNHARVLLRAERAAEALVLLDEAGQMADTHAGERSPLSLSLRVSRVEAVLALRRLDQARDLLAELDAPALPPPLAARALILRGRLAAARGEHGAATQWHADASRAIDALGPGGAALRSDLDALTAALRRE